MIAQILLSHVGYGGLNRVGNQIGAVIVHRLQT